MAEIRRLKYLWVYSLPAFHLGPYVGDFLPVSEQVKVSVTCSVFPDSRPVFHTANFRGYTLTDLEFVDRCLKKGVGASRIEQIVLEKRADIIALPFGRFPGRKQLNGAYLLYRIKDGAEEKIAKAQRRT